MLSEMAISHLTSKRIVCQISGFSTYPFYIGYGWERVTPGQAELSCNGDAVVGNDVWIGYDSLTVPGVKIGSGAIVSSRSTVVSDVPPYSVVGGNPAKLIKLRFSRMWCSRSSRLPGGIGI